MFSITLSFSPHKKESKSAPPRRKTLSLALSISVSRDSLPHCEQELQQERSSNEARLKRIREEEKGDHIKRNLPSFSLSLSQGGRRQQQADYGTVSSPCLLYNNVKRTRRSKCKGSWKTNKTTKENCDNAFRSFLFFCSSLFSFLLLPFFHSPIQITRSFSSFFGCKKTFLSLSPYWIHSFSSYIFFVFLPFSSLIHLHAYFFIHFLNEKLLFYLSIYPFFFFSHTFPSNFLSYSFL